MASTSLRLLIVSLSISSSVGCSGTSGRRVELDGGADSDTDVDVDTDVDTDTDSDTNTGTDTGTDTGSDTDTGTGVDDSEALDLLFMVDNSNSMRQEQANLTSNFSELVGLLATPPDEDDDGVADYPPLTNLHVGVVSSDMGTAGFPVATCDDAERGDDGVLQHLPSPSVLGCEDEYPRFLTYDVEDPEGLGKSFQCIATLGTGGCGFEQQLAAIEKALTVHSAPGGVNDGFLRDGAILGIVILSDEDDCTVEDPGIFADEEELGPLGVRCFNNPEMVRPREEIVESILSLKPGAPERIVVAGIVGVPVDLTVLTEEDLRSGDIMTWSDFQDILDDPRMQEEIDYGMGGLTLVPSCDVPGLGEAYPPRRIVEFIRDLDAEGNGGVVQSICQADYGPAMEAVARLVQSRLGE